MHVAPPFTLFDQDKEVFCLIVIKIKVALLKFHSLGYVDY